MVIPRARSLAAAALALITSAVPAAERPRPCSTTPWRPFIAEAAGRFDFPQQWVLAVMRAESAGCEFMNDKPTTSSAGAMGLMQLMPATWSQFRARLDLGDDPYDPRDNILASTAYLRDLYDRFGSPGFLAAYHAGPERYEQFLRGDRSLPSQTLDYLHRVQRGAGSSVEPDSLVSHTDTREHRSPFVMRKRTGQAADSPLEQPSQNTVFVTVTRGSQHGGSHTTERPNVQDP
ncbi:MAG: lytic transglycosylase domain-containing protein [Gammaproteobacteria bacterium]